MEVRALSRQELPIGREHDIITVRRRVRELAQVRGFDTFATAAVTTAASELARNVWVHARGGRAIVEELTDGVRSGLRLCFEDQGPGIDDLARVLSGGYSTAGSLGLGVSGTRRLVDEFDIASEIGSGTIVTVTKWTRF